MSEELILFLLLVPVALTLGLLCFLDEYFNYSPDRMPTEAERIAAGPARRIAGGMVFSTVPTPAQAKRMHELRSSNCTHANTPTGSDYCAYCGALMHEVIR